MATDTKRIFRADFMSRHINILSFFLLLSILVRAQEDRTLYYPTGTVQLVSKFDPACHCDRETGYYQSGKVHYEMRYVYLEDGDTKPDGEDITYFENGAVMIYYFWKDGAPDGRIYCNDVNNKLSYENYYANKFKTGTWKYYNGDGSLRREMIFEPGKTLWNSDSDYALNKFYLDGKLVYTETLVAGYKTNTTISNKALYDRLMAAEPPLGQKLFNQNCALCHSANTDLVGPKLAGVAKTRRKAWLAQMISDGEALMKSGDKDAQALYKKWNNVRHPKFERLSKEDVQAIIGYLQTFR